MAPKIENIVDRSVHPQKTLGLIRCFESPHASLRNPDWLMQELCSIIGVLARVVDGIRDEFTVSNTVAPQLVGDDSSGFTATHSWQSLEEAIRCRSVPVVLKKHIDEQRLGFFHPAIVAWPTLTCQHPQGRFGVALEPSPPY